MHSSVNLLLANYVYFGGCVLGFIAIFLPFIGVEVGDKSKMVSLMEEPDGIVFVILFIIAIVLNMFRWNIASTIASGVTMLFLLTDIYTASAQVDEYSDIADFCFAIDATILCIVAIVMIASSVVAVVISKKERAIKSAELHI